jgi:hypothetical protein
MAVQGSAELQSLVASCVPSTSKTAEIMEKLRKARVENLSQLLDQPDEQLQDFLLDCGLGLVNAKFITADVLERKARIQANQSDEQARVLNESLEAAGLDPQRCLRILRGIGIVDRDQLFHAGQNPDFLLFLEQECSDRGLKPPQRKALVQLAQTEREPADEFLQFLCDAGMGHVYATLRDRDWANWRIAQRLTPDILRTADISEPDISRLLKLFSRIQHREIEARLRSCGLSAEQARVVVDRGLDSVQMIARASEEELVACGLELGMARCVISNVREQT